MKVSLNWVKFINQKYGCASDPSAGGVDKLIEKIGSQLGAVDEVIYTGKKYEGLLVVRVVSCQKHSNADKLSVCLVDDGRVTPKVKRDNDGYIQVVCGAPNVRAGMRAVWIPPGRTVPSSFEKGHYTVESLEIRGVISHGMLASAKELSLGDEHGGILEVVEEIKPGREFAKAFELNDYVIDIENKMFTHRPDLFGQLGIARELAGIKHQSFKSPAWYQEKSDLHTDGRKNVLKLAVRNELPELVPRFSAVAIKDIKVEESPVWLKVRLSSVGVRPINNIVDITNYLMIETGQPLHAYDYDKVKTGVLGARKAKDGEKLMLLGGKKIKLEKDCIVITDGENPIGLAGVMGGAGTDVDKKTKNIILEVANFDMNTTRRTAMRYGLFTDASTRFSKNQSPRQTRTVLVKAVSDIKRIAGGRAASPIVDDNHYIAVVKPVKVSVGFINSRLGLGLKAGEAARLLSNVEFKVSTSGQNLEVTPPFWRTDIEIPEDIVEEIGRLYGYDRLPVVLPEHDLTPAPNDELLSFKRRLRAILASAGGQEVLNYSFVHGNLLEKAGQNKTKAYKLANALSPNSQYYRLSLTPSLLDKVHPNQKLGFKEFALFEINKTHIKPYKDTLDKDLPREFEMLGFVFASSQKFIKTNGSPMYHVRTFLDYLSKELGIKFSYKILPQSNKSAVVAPFEHSRTAEICDADSKIPIGIVGEYRDSLVQGLKLPKFCAGFEIDIEQLLKIIPTQQSYRPLNRYPELEQDFCLRAPAKHTYAELTDFMEKQLRLESQVHGYSAEIWPLDIYKRQGDKNHKQTTWRIILWHPDRTLTTAESNNLLEKIAASAKKELNAERL